ncbi:TPA: hypothetical protein ACH3X1_001532 [Trebouxia sp. C0004]
MRKGRPVNHPLIDRVRECSATPDAAADFFRLLFQFKPEKRLLHDAACHAYLSATFDRMNAPSPISCDSRSEVVEDGETSGHDGDGDDDCASSSEQSSEQAHAQQSEQPASEASLLQTPEHHAMLLPGHPPEQHQSLHTDADLLAQVTPGEQLACSSAAHAYLTALDRMKTVSLMSRNTSLDMVKDGEIPGHVADDGSSSAEQSNEHVPAQQSSQPFQPASLPSLPQVPEHHAMRTPHPPPEQLQSLHTDAESSEQLMASSIHLPVINCCKEANPVGSGSDDSQPPCTLGVLMPEDPCLLPTSDFTPSQQHSDKQVDTVIVDGPMTHAEASLNVPTMQQALSVALPLVCASSGAHVQPKALSDYIWSIGVKCWQISSGVQTGSCHTGAN